MKIATALAAVTGALPAAEERPGQQRMAQAVADAIEQGRHLVVQAGTGTGKTIGYLVPAILAGKTVVVATATKALQDQLASKDLPFLEAHVGVPFEWAVLKGRSNYVCMQRVSELQARDKGQMEIEEFAPTIRVEINRLADWTKQTSTGDQAELTWAPTDKAWQAVSVGSDECPGASRCPKGPVCFAEAARDRAAAASVIVVNMHLYGLHVGSGGVILPEHDVVVVDEAHQLEDIMSDTVGVQISGGRFTTLTAALKRILDDPAVVGPIAEASVAVRDALGSMVGQRLPVPFPDAVQGLLVDLRGRLQKAQDALRAIETEVDEAKQRKLRGQQLTTRLQETIDLALGKLDGYVAFVGGGPDFPRLEIAPLDVGPVLANGIWAQRTAILTSATIPASLGARVGLPPEQFDEIDVGSPFDYEHHALLYCALHMPDPRSPGYGPAVHDELVALIQAAGGRTLGAVHQLQGHGRRRRGSAGEGLLPGLHPTRTAQDSPGQSIQRRRTRVSVRDLGLLPGRRHSGPHIEPGGHRPHSVPSARRPLAVGAPRVARGGRLRTDRPAAGGDVARPGHRPPDPQRHRPGGRRGDGPEAREGQLSLGHREGAAADATHTTSIRGGGVPPRDHGLTVIGRDGGGMIGETSVGSTHPRTSASAASSVRGNGCEQASSPTATVRCT